MRSTRASEIEERGVWLATVSEEFVEALEDLREGRPARKPDRYDRDEDEERPRRREAAGVPLAAWLLGGGGLVLLLAGVLVLVLTRDGGTGNETTRDNSPARPAGPGGQPGGGFNAQLPAASKLTEENFRKLKLNMTAADVRAILGPEQDEVPGVGMTWNEGPNLISVNFNNNRLILASGFINGNRLALPTIP
jgi:hypothetical protein